MKAFTDISQSNTLSKILPLESADMLWGYYYNGKDYCVPNIRPFRDMHDNIPKGYTHAWSLAALLGVLPKMIEIEWVAYELSIYLNGLYYWNINNGNLLLEVKGKDNLVDACVAMIEKLNELNLL